MSNDSHEDEIQRPAETEGSEKIQSPMGSYTKEEIGNAVEVIKMLIEVRDRARKEGKINW
jgi:hypothetical protein